MSQQNFAKAQARMHRPLESESRVGRLRERDYRIDFFRGLALMMVLVDHIEGWSRKLLLRNWTIRSFGLSDAAEIFVFLSGFVFAVAYQGTLEKKGLSACLRKACKRSLQIYVAYLLAAWTVIAIGAIFIEWRPPEGHGLRVGERAWESVWASFSFRFQPWGFPILAFYVMVLPFMSLLLYLGKRAAWVAWTCSLALYLVVQFYPELTFYRFADDKPWDFNPLGWQFLFYIGVFLGSHRDTKLPTGLRTLLLLVSIVVLAIGLLAARGINLVETIAPSLADSLEWLRKLGQTWAGKQTLHPVRIIHFLSLMFVVSQLVPRSVQFWSRRVFQPLIVCGQQSLEVYALGLVLAFAGAFILLRVSEPRNWILMVDLDACLISIGFAYLIRVWKSRETQPGLGMDLG